jgi:hypothetical protein
MRVRIYLPLLLADAYATVGCGSSGDATSKPAPSILPAYNNGVSGMAQIDRRRYLAVHVPHSKIETRKSAIENDSFRGRLCRDMV